MTRSERWTPDAQAAQAGVARDEEDYHVEQSSRRVGHDAAPIYEMSSTSLLVRVELSWIPFREGKIKMRVPERVLEGVLEREGVDA